MLQVGPPSLHYCCAVVLRSSIVLPPVGQSSKHEYHCCQLTGQSRGVSNFYHTLKFFIGLTFILFSIILAIQCILIQNGRHSEYKNISLRNFPAYFHILHFSIFQSLF